LYFLPPRQSVQEYFEAFTESNSKSTLSSASNQILSTQVSNTNQTSNPGDKLKALLTKVAPERNF
jgi:hypothetical protein